jgi:hypothetical protein
MKLRSIMNKRSILKPKQGAELYGEFYLKLSQESPGMLTLKPPSLSKKMVVEREPNFLFSSRFWLTDYPSRFTAQQRGWFLTLLCEAWLNGTPQGTLANDWTTLASLFDWSLNENNLQDSSDAILKNLPLYEVFKYFLPVQGMENRLHNEWLTVTLMEAMKRRKYRVVAGQISGRKRKEKPPRKRRKLMGGRNEITPQMIRGEDL